MKLRRYGRDLERLGQRYRLDGSLGSGAVADVCLAWDEWKAHEVAIKVIKSEDLDQDLLNRFLHEASQIVGWDHPNILRVLEDVELELIDPNRGSVVPYIVMEYADGGDLQKRLTFGVPNPLGQTVHIFSQLCSAIDYAHSQGIVHGDIKPLNVLFRILPDGTEQVALSDFGLAIQLEVMHYTFSRQGTLAYLAPEQFDDQVSPASDIFSLGVVLYQMCTGRLPYKRTIRDLKEGVVDTPPELPSHINRELPEAIDEIVLRALASDPVDRYATARDLWKDLQAATRLPFQPARETSPVIPPRPKQNSRPNLPHTPEPEEVDDLEPPSLEELAALGIAGSAGLVAEMDRASMDDMYEDRNEDLLVDDARDPAAIRLSAQRPAMPPRRPVAGVMPSAREIDTPRQQPVGRSPSKSSPGSRGGPTRQLSQAELEEIPTRRERPSRPVRTQTGPLRVATAAAGGVINAERTVQMKAPPAKSQNSKSSQKQKRTRFLWLGIVLSLVLLFILGSIVFASGQAGNVGAALHLPIPTPTPYASTIVLTPTKANVDKTYTIKAVQKPGEGQVEARQITSDKSDSKTVTATGAGSTPGKNAQGLITFFNGAGQRKTIVAGTTITGNSGVTVVTDNAVDLPAASVASRGQANVTAHAANGGTQGNIPANDINTTCCGANDIFVVNGGFGGGANPEKFTFVQQGDIDNAIGGLKPALLEQARADVNGKLDKKEKFTGETGCDTTQADASQNAGDHANAVTVTVAVRCSNEAYNLSNALDTATQKFTKDVGDGFKPVGKINTNVLKTTVGNDGVVSLKIQATGSKVPVFTVQQKETIARMIAGKTKKQAQSILENQGGVSSIGINISGGDGSLLPRNPNSITIAVQDVQ